MLGSWLLFGLSIAIGIVALLEQQHVLTKAARPYIAVLMMTLPVVSLVFSRWSKSMALVVRSENSPFRYPSLLFPVAITLVCSLIYNQYVFQQGVLGVSYFAIFVPGIAAVYLSVQEYVPLKYKAVVLAVGLLPAYLYTSIMYINGSFTSPTTHTYITESIAATSKSEKKDVRRVRLIAWRDGVDDMEIRTERRMEYFSKASAPIVVTEATDLLGIRWVDGVEFPSNKQASKYKKLQHPFEVE